MVVRVHPEMAFFVLIGVLRGFPAAAYRRTPSCPVSGGRKPLCGLDQNKNCSFLNWTPGAPYLGKALEFKKMSHIFIKLYKYQMVNY